MVGCLDSCIECLFWIYCYDMERSKYSQIRIDLSIEDWYLSELGIGFCQEIESVAILKAFNV